MLLNRPPVHKSAQNTEPVAPVQTVVEPEPVVEAPVQTVVEPEPVVEAPVQTVVEPEPVAEAPVQTVAEPVKPVVEEENDNVLSIADDIAEINEPVPFPVLSAPKLAPKPIPAPKPSAPKHNSYMDLFAKKKPEAVSEPVYDPTFDPTFTTAPAPTPAPAPIPAPAPAPVGMDFDFDILGNESATASRTSTRALNAVEDLAKAKAKAEAEKLKQQKELEEKAAQSDNSYDIINNSIDSELTDNGYAQSNDEPSYSSPSDEGSLTSAAPNIGNIDMSDDEEDTYTDSADDMVVEDYNEYEIENLTAADLLVPEEPVQQSSHKRTDFLKLQQEIEESIELNRKIRDKERTRNMRESERKAFEEAEKNPKKGIKQPEDADVFFKRPGKDYYSSDSMPEIKFNRHGR